jgi:hypothetical protein
MLPEPPSFETRVTVRVRRIYGSERGDTTTRESRIKREIGVQIHEEHEQSGGKLALIVAAKFVIPAKAGIQPVVEDCCGVPDSRLDSRFRGNDRKVLRVSS